jgi:hypothetical protein
MSTPEELKERLSKRSWATYTPQERTAWLYIFVLEEKVAPTDEGNFALLGTGQIITAKPSISLVYRCEQAIKNTDYEGYYVDTCLIEISNLTHKGINSDGQPLPEDTAKNFYKNAIMLPVDLRAKSLFWAKKKMKIA